jgi:hypothetical protein
VSAERCFHDKPYLSAGGYVAAYREELVKARQKLDGAAIDWRLPFSIARSAPAESYVGAAVPLGPSHQRWQHDPQRCSASVRDGVFGLKKPARAQVPNLPG